MPFNVSQLLLPPDIQVDLIVESEVSSLFHFLLCLTLTIYQRVARVLAFGVLYSMLKSSDIKPRINIFQNDYVTVVALLPDEWGRSICPDTRLQKRKQLNRTAAEQGDRRKSQIYLPEEFGARVFKGFRVVQSVEIVDWWKGAGWSRHRGMKKLYSLADSIPL